MLLTERNIAVVVNPLHQKALQVADAVMQRLKQKNIEHSVFTTTWPTDWTDITEAWVIGGDGTLHCFINRYPQFHLPIAVFKGGTGNDFHWLLYGDVSVDEQLMIVLSAMPQPVDAGLCNDRLFINGVGIGFDGKVVADLVGKKKRSGKTSYLLTILKNIFRFRGFLCSVHTENFRWGKKCFMISVANGKRYGGGFRVTPKSLVNDGLLDTNIVGTISALRRLRYLPVIEKGKHVDLPFVTYVKSRMVIVKALQQLPAHADGEAFSATEFNIECLPGRFLFLCQHHPSRPGK